MKTPLWFVLAACLTTSVLWQTVDAKERSACDKGQVSRASGACEDPDDIDMAVEEVAPQHGIPKGVCRLGYAQQGARLCMTGTRGPNTYTNAVFDCMENFGRLADYNDWRYRIFRGDGVAAPVGFWLGPITADNLALFVNLPNVADFDGETSRFDSRSYVCAHDDGK